MDAFLDLWLNTVYDDNRVQSSVVDPVVYMRNETGKPTLDCGQLAKRWNVSASTAEKYLQKLKNNGYIYYKETIGENGLVVYLLLALREQSGTRNKVLQGLGRGGGKNAPRVDLSMLV